MIFTPQIVIGTMVMLTAQFLGWHAVQVLAALYTLYQLQREVV